MDGQGGLRERPLLAAAAARQGHDAMRLLARLAQAATVGGRTGRLIEILMLQALTHQAPGQLPEALAALERALALAEPEGYVRLFVDEGEPMAALLREAVKGDGATLFAQQLLAARAFLLPSHPVTPQITTSITRYGEDLSPH